MKPLLVIIAGSCLAATAGVICTMILRRRECRVSPIDTPFSCKCGKFKATVHVEMKKSVCCECRCGDCIRWLEFVPRPDNFKRRVEDAWSAVQLWQTDFITDTPVTPENVISSKLEGGNMMRCHSSCCKTPLFLLLDKPFNPIIILSRDCFAEEKDDEIFGPVTWMLNGSLPVRFLFSVIMRSIEGTILGKRNPIFYDNLHRSIEIISR